MLAVNNVCHTSHKGVLKSGCVILYDYHQATHWQVRHSDLELRHSFETVKGFLALYFLLPVCNLNERTCANQSRNRSLQRIVAVRKNLSTGTD